MDFLDPDEHTWGLTLEKFSHEASAFLKICQNLFFTFWMIQKFTCAISRVSDRLENGYDNWYDNKDLRIVALMTNMVMYN